jgi:hypothetical protein
VRVFRGVNGMEKSLEFQQGKRSLIAVSLDRGRESNDNCARFSRKQLDGSSPDSGEELLSARANVDGLFLPSEGER